MAFEHCNRCPAPQQLTELSHELDAISAELLGELGLRLELINRARAMYKEDYQLDKTAESQVHLRERQARPIGRATRMWHEAQERAEYVVAAIDCGESPATCPRTQLALGVMVAEYVGVEDIVSLLDTKPAGNPEADQSE